MSGPLMSLPAAAVLLTRRETEVLRLAAEGLTDRQIAQRLRIRTRTVSTHMFNLRGRLAAANRTHAAVLAVRYGLISLHAPARPPVPAPPTAESRG